MSDMNANDVRSINRRLFEQIVRFECEASVGTGRYVRCGKPATAVIEWRHQDGDDEQRILCADHAFAEVCYWSMMDWETRVKVAHIEDRELGLSYGGRTATRVRKQVQDTRGTDPIRGSRRTEVSYRHAPCAQRCLVGARTEAR